VDSPDPEQQKYIAAARRAQLDERMASIVNGALKNQQQH